MQPEESDALRRIMDSLPAGLVSVNRVARMCIKAGAPIVEAELADRTRRLVESGIDPAAVKP
jgi:hypothetical protein